MRDRFLVAPAKARPRPARDLHNTCQEKHLMSSRMHLPSLASIAALALCAQGAFAQKGSDPGTPVDGLSPCQMNATTLCIPLDASFSVVPMDADTGGNGQANPGDPCQRNDDDSSLSIPLQFTFNLYGQSFTDLFINNNGNVTFDQPYAIYSPFGFPVAGFPMVAPFWGDVDTRSSSNASGIVYYRSEPHRFVVIWDHVGYFNQNTDKQDTFELILSDGTDTTMGLGNNVCFCYDNMDWTTGDASGGSGGLGGTPATVGANKGDGTQFFQVGLFDHAGTDYDGPGGNTDGVDHLDHTDICFNATGQSNNIAPILTQGVPGDLLAVVEGSTTDFDIEFISPELNQTTTITIDAGGLNGFSAVLTAGTQATAACTLVADPGQLGLHTVKFTATDDDPQYPLPTDYILTVDIEPSVVLIDNGCAGSHGPLLLTFTGTLEPASAAQINVAGGPSNSPGVLLVGIEEAELSRKGCSLLFIPQVNIPFSTKSDGQHSQVAHWPAGVPEGLAIFLQAYVVDPGAGNGWASSDTVRITTP
jgi:hypothetical protein